MKGFHERQRQKRISGLVFDFPERRPQVRLTGGGHDEPQVEAVFARVVVIDFGKTVDSMSDFFQHLRRHAHGGQGRSAEALGREHRANAADLAFLLQLGERVEHMLFGQPQTTAQFGERPWMERETVLEVVQQAMFTGCDGGIHDGIRNQCGARGR